jgi:hypothetical protein
MKNLENENQIYRGVQHKLTEMFEAVKGKTFDETEHGKPLEIEDYRDFLYVVSDVISNEHNSIDVEEKEQYKIEEHNRHLSADIGYD